MSNFGKISIPFKDSAKTKLRELSDKLRIGDIDHLEIGHATVKVFELLRNSIPSLFQVRRQKYHNLALSSRSKIQPAFIMLLPSLKVAFQQRLRVFYRLLV